MIVNMGIVKRCGCQLCTAKVVVNLKDADVALMLHPSLVTVDEIKGDRNLYLWGNSRGG